MKLVCTGQVIVVQSGMQLCEPFHVGYKNVAIWFFHFIPEIEHFFFLNLREGGNSFSPTGRALIQFPSTPEEGWTWEPLQPLPCNDNFLFCGCDKLLYQTPTSPALPSLPRKLWGSSAYTGHSAEEQGLHDCHSKQKRIIQVSFSRLTAEKLKEITSTLLFLAVLVVGVHSE